MSDTEAKTKPASKRKLRKLRQEGSIAQSAEAAGFLAVAAGTVAVLAFGASVFAALIEIFEITADAMTMPFDEALRAAPAAAARQIAWILAPVAGASLVASVVAALIYNGGLVFAIKPVAPQLERISPLSGLKRIYGRRGWIETAATFVRIALWLVYVALVAWIWLPGFAGAVQCGLSCQARMAIPPAWLLGIGLVVITVLAAVADMLIQKSLFLFEQMMTESEVKQERKEAFGDPGIRKERRKRQREEPPDPDAVGLSKANLCFFAADGAVAIRYHPKHARIPRVCAKAAGAEARTMRRMMANGGLTMAQSAEIVQGCRGCPPGGAMPADLYETFAKVLKKALTG